MNFWNIDNFDFVTKNPNNKVLRRCKKDRNHQSHDILASRTLSRGVQSSY